MDANKDGAEGELGVGVRMETDRVMSDCMADFSIYVRVRVRVKTKHSPGLLSLVRHTG